MIQAVNLTQDSFLPLPEQKIEVNGVVVTFNPGHAAFIPSSQSYQAQREWVQSNRVQLIEKGVQF